VKVLTPASAISPGGLLADYFVGSSWDLWRAVLKAAYAEPMSRAELALFREVAERDPPLSPVSELWCIIGRGGGKDSIASAIATVAALGTNDFLRPGEVGTIFCLATDRTQAKIAHRFVSAYFREDEHLAPLVVRESDDTIALCNRIEIVTAANSFRSIRGRSVVCAILDECAFSPSLEDESSRPIEETYNALMPALARVPGSRLIGISTPYRKSGLLYEKWQESYGKPDPDILVVRDTSRQFNPTLSQRMIDAALQRDREAAGAEWLAQWRSDISDYIDRELVQDCVLRGCHQLPYTSGINYHAFVDPAGGSGADSMTLAIAHSADGRVTIDCVVEVRPKFNPTTAVLQFCSMLQTYGVTAVTGDNYGSEWCRQPFRDAGVEYEHSDKVRSELYLEFLPLVNSGRVEWIDNPRIVSQLCGLERRVARSGRDMIDHGRSGHDDIANVVAGAACLAAADEGRTVISPEALAMAWQATAYGRGNRWGLQTPVGGVFGLPHSVSLSDLAGQ